METKNSVLYISKEKFETDYFAKMLDDNYMIYKTKDEKESFRLLNDAKCNIAVIIIRVSEFNKKWSDFIGMVTDNWKSHMIPIIIVTKSKIKSDEIRFLESGITDYITEPIDGDIFRLRVDNIINSRRTSSISNNRIIDNLTLLLTKNSFYKKASYLLKNNPDTEYDIICSDIDDFQFINVMFGIKKGDEILKKIAKKYVDNIDEDEICARVGIDHFMALIKRKGKENQKFLDKLTLKDEDEHCLKNLDIKFGLFKIKNRDMDVSEMCDRAYIALKTIKKKYGMQFAWYNEELYLKLLNEQCIIKNMEEALLNHNFKVFFQPKYNIDNNKIIGAEALVRWIHPKRGIIPPLNFIPIFEKNGFITKLDLYVLEEVCKMIRIWLDKRYSVVPISVNISRKDIHELDLVKVINKLLLKYNLSCEYIHIEITESAYTDDPENIIEKVKDLRNSGILIEMDDFGKGYSSLNMLSDLPIDMLKLDASFIKKDFNDINNRNILSFIISLAKSMNLKVIAEGVETREQIERLKKLKCSFVQGYFYSKPVPADEFSSFL